MLSTQNRTAGYHEPLKKCLWLVVKRRKIKASVEAKLVTARLIN